MQLQNEKVFMSFCLLSPQFNDPSQQDEIDLRQPMVSTTSQVGSPRLSRPSLYSLSAIVRGMASSTPIQPGFIIRFFLPFGEVVSIDAMCAR